MITNLLSSRSLLRQFLAFNLFVFLILGFFTFLYLLAIEPELVNRKSKKHQNIINNLSININSQNIKDDQNSLKNFLLKSKFILDEIDQIRFFNFDKEMIIDSSILDIDKKSFFVTERIQTLGINEKLNQSEDISNKNNNIKLDYNFLNDLNNKLNQKYFIFSEKKNKNFLIHTSAYIEVNNKKLIVTISEISNDITLAVRERKNLYYVLFLLQQL